MKITEMFTDPITITVEPHPELGAKVEFKTKWQGKGRTGIAFAIEDEATPELLKLFKEHTSACMAALVRHFQAKASIPLTSEEAEEQARLEREQVRDISQ